MGKNTGFNFTFVFLLLSVLQSKLKGTESSYRLSSSSLSSALNSVEANTKNSEQVRPTGRERVADESRSLAILAFAPRNFRERIFTCTV